MLRQWHPSNIHVQRIHGEHAAHQRLPHANYQLDGFSGFQTADHADHRTQDASFLASRNLASGRHVAENTAIARAFTGNDGHHLTCESDHTRMNIRFIGQYTSVIDKELRGEIVGGLYHQIVCLDEAGDIVGINKLIVSVDRHVRVEFADVRSR